MKVETVWKYVGRVYVNEKYSHTVELTPQSR
jgi:hypothetical protein